MPNTRQRRYQQRLRDTALRLAPLSPKLGQICYRRFENGYEIPLTVTALTPHEVRCGAWVFDRHTGAELDLALGWGPWPKPTGSYLKTWSLAKIKEKVSEEKV